MLIRDKPAQPILSFPRKHGQVPKTLTNFKMELKKEDRLYPRMCREISNVPREISPRSHGYTSK
jgi:hypothetical protein